MALDTIQRERGATLQALRAKHSYQLDQRMRNRTTFAHELCMMATNAAIQIDAGNEPYFLRPDPFNVGYFLQVAIYDHAQQNNARDYCQIEVHAGSVLVPPDTLIYWV